MVAFQILILQGGRVLKLASEQGNEFYHSGGHSTVRKRVTKNINRDSSGVTGEIRSAEFR